VAFIVCVFVASLIFTIFTETGSAKAHAFLVTRCSDSQLVLATEPITGASGTDGPIVLIANRSHRTCFIQGFPHIGFETTDGTTLKVKVFRHESMIYGEPKARRALIHPGAVASFGVSYGEEYVPRIDTPARCLAQFLFVKLPTTHGKVGEPLYVPTSIDVCRAHWEVALTPIELGARVQGP
jgi:hypothetical protein